MTVFGCANCGTPLTVPVARVALPAHAFGRYGCGYGMLPPLLDPGTYAVSHEPFGGPWRRWGELSPGEAEKQGEYAVSFGPRGAVRLAPGALTGTVLIPRLDDGNCRGMCAGTAANLTCGTCGLPVARRIDDCGYWQEDVLDPGAVMALSSVDGVGRPIVG